MTVLDACGPALASCSLCFISGALAVAAFALLSSRKQTLRELQTVTQKHPR